MSSLVRARLFVTQMRRGRLHASSRRHDPFVDGPYRPSGRNASPSGITHHPSCRRPGSRYGPWTEIRLSARAHTISTTNHAHAPPAAQLVDLTSIPDTCVLDSRSPAQIRSLA